MSKPKKPEPNDSPAENEPEKELSKINKKLNKPKSPRPAKVPTPQAEREEAEEMLNEDFRFPERVLNQISECSPLGFILFVIGEDGSVQFFTANSTPDIIDVGLRTSAAKVLASISKIESAEITNGLFHNRMMNEEDGEEDQEEE